jgi:hypothetical protein
MTIRRICTVCFRDNSDVLFYHIKYDKPIHEIVKDTDLLKYGRLCCIPHLVNARETINLHEQKLKKYKEM